MAWKRESAFREKSLQRNSMYRTRRFATSKGLWLFLFRQSFELWSGECKYHNELGQKPVTLAMTPDSRLLKNNEGNRDGVWDFCRGKEADIALFLQVKKLRQIRKIYWARWTKHSTQTLVFTKTPGRRPGWAHCYLRSSLGIRIFLPPCKQPLKLLHLEVACFQ